MIARRTTHDSIQTTGRASQTQWDGPATIRQCAGHDDHGRRGEADHQQLTATRARSQQGVPLEPCRWVERERDDDDR